MDTPISTAMENQLLDTLREVAEAIPATASLTQVGIAVDDSVRLTVVGSGGGLDATEPARQFSGLRENARRAGASIEVEVVPGGRRLMLAIPAGRPDPPVSREGAGLIQAGLWSSPGPEEGP